MKLLMYSSIFFLFIISGCGKTNDQLPEDIKNEIIVDIENKYGINLEGKGSISKVLIENKTQYEDILTLNYIVGRDTMVSVFDLITKKELGSYKLNKKPIKLDEKEIVSSAIVIKNKTNTHIYGYIYYNLKNDEHVDSYQLFASEIGSNKIVSDDLFGNKYYFWSSSEMAYSLKPWYDKHILIESEISYPEKQNGYFVIGTNHELVIDGSSYKDYYSGLNIKGAFTYDKTVIIISNDLAIYDLQTNKYHNLGLDVNEDERLGIDSIKHNGNTVIINIDITSYLGIVTAKTIIVDLEIYKISIS